MKQTIQSVLLHGILLLIAAGMIFPMFWMILLSLREHPESYETFFSLLSAPTVLKNYADALGSDTFGMYFLNSVIVGLVVTVGNMLFCLMCGYAFARRDFIGKPLLFMTILGVLIIPPQVIMIPLYRLMVQFGWRNTYRPEDAGRFVAAGHT